MNRVTADGSALILRLASGLIFLPHGWSKVAGEGGSAAFATDVAANYGLPAFLGHIAAHAEVIGAVMLIIGLLTRVAALVLAGTMFVAAFIVQLPDALFEVPPNAIKFFVVLRGIELPLAMFAMTCALLLTGAGRVSVDHVLRGMFEKSRAARSQPGET
jgi:putative oxidoreductase